MQLHEISPLSSMEQQFLQIYEKHAAKLQFSPENASYAEFLALRKAMLPELDSIFQTEAAAWHRLPAYLPDALKQGDRSDFQLVASICYARYIPMPVHASESYEIVLCPSGRNKYFIGQTQVDLCAEDVLILAPGAANATGAFAQDCIRRNILLRRQRTAEHFSELLEGSGTLAQFLRHTINGSGGDSLCLYHTGKWLLENPQIAALYRMQRREVSAQVALENGLLKAFLAELELCYGATAEMLCCEFPTIEDALMDCLRREFATIQRQELAGRFGYSERQVLRIIQRHTGMAFKAHMLQLRLDYVADMLINTSYPILQILSSAGFENSRSFYDLFRQRYSMTPKQYRLTCQNNKR